jgi:hypothetical protein
MNADSPQNHRFWHHRRSLPSSRADWKNQALNPRTEHRFTDLNNSWTAALIHVWNSPGFQELHLASISKISEPDPCGFRSNVITGVNRVQDRKHFAQARRKVASSIWTQQGYCPDHLFLIPGRPTMAPTCAPCLGKRLNAFPTRSATGD